tara:strand:+ start:224 stop:499 length:276 start_codon:yes stop_codon:yes gene_type:complete
MKKVTIVSLFVSLIATSFAIANEVNIFNARHYKADKELYSKFTDKTGIKVNLINGKASALEKRMIEEGQILMLTFILLPMPEDVELSKLKE